MRQHIFRGGPVNSWRWRSARRYVRAHQPLPDLRSHLDQAESLLSIVDAFDASWPSHRHAIERRLVWLGLEDPLAYQISDIVHLLLARPHEMYRAPTHSTHHRSAPKRRAS